MSAPEWYIVQANRTEKRGTWTASIQVPTFYLNARTQGIKNTEHAATIANEILGKDCAHCVHPFAPIIFDQTTNDLQEPILQGPRNPGKTHEKRSNA